MVDFSGCAKLFGFIAVLFDLSSEIQSLDFVKDVSGLLSPFSTLFLSCALCHPLSPLSFRPRSQFLPRFLCWPVFPHAISLSPAYLPFLSSLSVTLFLSQFLPLQSCPLTQKFIQLFNLSLICSTYFAKIAFVILCRCVHVQAIRISNRDQQLNRFHITILSLSFSVFCHEVPSPLCLSFSP